MDLIQAYPAGHVIFQENDPSDGFFIIQSGLVQIYREVATESGPQEVELAQLAENEVFGEMGLIDLKGRSAHARALKPTVVHFISYESFAKDLFTLPPWHLTFVMTMVRRLRRMNQLVTKAELEARAMRDVIAQMNAESEAQPLRADRPARSDDADSPNTSAPTPPARARRHAAPAQRPRPTPSPSKSARPAPSGTATKAKAKAKPAPAPVKGKGNAKVTVKPKSTAKATLASQAKSKTKPKPQSKPSAARATRPAPSSAKTTKPAPSAAASAAKSTKGRAKKVAPRAAATPTRSGRARRATR